MTLSTNFLNKLLLFSLLLLLLSAGQAPAADAPAQVGPLLFSSSQQPGGQRIAIFPTQNLSGNPAPGREVSLDLASMVEQTGAQLVPDPELQRFIERHRVRQMGYIDGQTAELLRQETGAEAVLLSAIEVFRDEEPPRFALITRLVETTSLPRILWMESVSMVGDQAPGILGLGIISDMKVLRGRVLDRIGTSLRAHLTNPPIRKIRPLASRAREEQAFSIQELIRKMAPVDDTPAPPVAGGGKAMESMFGRFFIPRYTPQGWYSAMEPLDKLQRAVAIIPFTNQSTRKNASELLELHLAKQLVSEGTFNVVEPGAIRDSMLKMHIVMNDGISNPNIDAISTALQIDMLLYGKVIDFTESTAQAASPLVDFTLQMYERDTRRILWSSRSRNRGDDGVWFYDVGRVASAAELADRMSRAMVLKFSEHATSKP